MDFYDLKVKGIWGNEVSLSDYRGKVLMIVNTASGCGFTPQYEGLEDLYAKYRDQGFEVLDFPCNQFMNQAPGTSEELAQFCQVRFGTKFQTFAKIDVNGKNADPLFVHLRENAPEAADGKGSRGIGKVLKNLAGDSIKWNFTKFLVDREGRVVARYEPATTPAAIEPHLRKLLDAG